MAKRRKKRRSSGLAGLPKIKAKEAGNELLDVALIAGGTILASKGVALLDRTINKNNSKVIGLVVPGVVTLAGLAGSIMGKGLIKSLSKGVTLGGGVKLAEKALNKTNLLSGVDDEPLMLPGIGDVGYANLPELSHYSENDEADVTTTGNDPQYYMGAPSEVLSGDEEGEDEEITTY